MMGDEHRVDIEHEVEFRVLGYEEQIPEGYSLTTVDQAANHHLARVTEACKLRLSKSLKDNEQVRLKNGLILWKREQEYVEVANIYQEKIKFKLVSTKPTSGEKLKQEDCLIALAYAAEHDGVEEVEELVECAGKEILTTRMPDMGTILHVCTNWLSTKTLKEVLEVYPKSVNVCILDRHGDTALHNLPNYWHVPRTYEVCKSAARLLFGLKGVHAKELLSHHQNDYGGFTAVCKALAYEERDVCRALLDAGKEAQEEQAAGKEAQEKQATVTPEASYWLTLRAHGCDIAGAYNALNALDDDDDDDDDADNAFCTALHLAVLKNYVDIVSNILAYPGAARLNLTSLPDHCGNTPLHTVAKVGHPEICSMLLKYSMEINQGGGSSTVTSPLNKADKTPLHIASTHGHAKVCEKLLEYYGTASLSLADKHGRYALTNAFAKHHTQVVEKLLDACLPRTQEDTPSTPATKSTLPKSRRSLVNEHLESGLTPLQHVAVAISSSRHISDLLKAGASIDSRSEDGRTPLHIATSKQGHVPHAFWSILQDEGDQKLPKDRKKAWINMRDISGQTALHYIVKHSAVIPQKTTFAWASTQEVLDKFPL